MRKRKRQRKNPASSCLRLKTTEMHLLTTADTAMQVLSIHTIPSDGSFDISLQLNILKPFASPPRHSCQSPRKRRRTEQSVRCSKHGDDTPLLDRINVADGETSCSATRPSGEHHRSTRCPCYFFSFFRQQWKQSTTLLPHG